MLYKDPWNDHKNIKMPCTFCHQTAKKSYLSYALCLDCYKEQMIEYYAVHRDLAPQDVLARLEDLEPPKP